MAFVLGVVAAAWGAWRWRAAAASTVAALREGVGAGERGEPRGRMNVLVLAAGSLRFDRLNPRTMPNMSGFAARATVFDRMYVSLPRTLPSWVSLLTGRHPHHHGIDSSFAPRADRARDVAALPSQFARAGYRTVVAGDSVADVFGRIDLGFAGVLDAPDLGLSDLDASGAPELFERLRPDEPFFAAVSLGAARRPYAPRAPYHLRFTAPGYRGPFKYHGPLDVARAQPVLRADDEAQLRGLYDGAVAQIDDAFGRIVRELASRHLAERTIVVLVADHGEQLNERGRGLGPGEQLFGDEGTHVPLVVFDPRHPVGRHEPRVVRDVDLAPTLYELAQVAPPAGIALDGRSLAPALSGEGLAPALAYAESDPSAKAGEAHPLVAAAKHRMVRDARFKLVYVPTRMGAEYTLYDTAQDPAEAHDVAAQFPEVLARLGEELRAYVARDPDLAFRDGMAVPRAPELPYSVLWIAIDGLRAGADGGLRAGAGEVLPPALDALVRSGVRFTDAHAAATALRPGTLALLAGGRPTEFGVEPWNAPLRAADLARYRAADPPLLARILRNHGARTRAVVNHPFMTGPGANGTAITNAHHDSPAQGLDMGFDQVASYRDPATTPDMAITRDATSFLRESSGARFFLFCNYGPEAAQTDEPLGDLLRALDEMRLRERTLLIVTSAQSETSHIPMIVALPGALPRGKLLSDRVRSIDLAPTVLELEGLEAPSRMSGRSLLPLLPLLPLPRDAPSDRAERVALTEGHHLRALLAGPYRLLLHGGREALFDRTTDPAETTNLAAARPDVVAEMRARLVAAETNVPVVGTSPEPRPTGTPIQLRFAGAGAAHRIQGHIEARTDALARGGPPRIRVEPAGIAFESFKVDAAGVEFAFSTASDGPVGFDLSVEPADAHLGWELYMDDRPWPQERIFAGPLGLSEPRLVHGIDTDEARSAILSAALPAIDAARDLGLFVTRAPRGSFSSAK
ncbi:sulfatase-like hydrolase/transferase [Pendulispora albinea]|uniref:Sulfatase-like hydrolase/transferase n=1 Tax=Pendulispora albinea TaxID=2741071 RepID=A0ABZ2LLB7_9BACT